MRAAVVKSFGAPDCIAVVKGLPKPVLKEKYEILVKVVSSGVNPVDTYIRSGQYGVLPQLPFMPHKDGAGEVVEVGSDVSTVKVGQRVYFTFSFTGTAAEYCLTSSAKTFSLPDDLTYAQGASLGVPYFTAYRALFLKGQSKKGDVVLVHGASGGVGLAACQLAASRGITVIGTAGTEHGLELVKQNGATDVYNHRDKDYVAQIKQKYPQGFDLILEMASHINLANDMTLIKKNGKIAIIGCRGETQINPRLLMTTESSIFGVALGQSTNEDYKETATGIDEMLRNTSFRPVIRKEYSLEEISQSHVDIMDSTVGASGNLVINL